MKSENHRQLSPAAPSAADHLTCPVPGGPGQARCGTMDQRDILLQNLERAQGKKLNRGEFAEEFSVSSLKAWLSVPARVGGNRSVTSQTCD